MPYTGKVSPGKGTTLSAEGSTIAQRVSIGGPDMTVGSAPTTHLDSTKVTKRPTIADAGALDLEIWYDPTLHATLFGYWKTPKSVSWVLTFMDGAPDLAGLPTPGSSMAFDGFLTGLKPKGMDVESNLGADISIEISGEITFTAAATP